MTDWHQARSCGICGVRDIPYGVEWPWWRDGRCVHWTCAEPSDEREEAKRLVRILYNPNTFTMPR